MTDGWRRALPALGLVAGALTILAAAMFLFIGGPGIAYSLAWVALQPKLEWFEGGAERARLQEIAMPPKVPALAPPTSEWYYPDGRGTGQGGTAVHITTRPGRREWVGVYTGAPPGTPAPDHGVVLDSERRPVDTFTLQGGTPPGVMSVVMPTPSVLLVVGTGRLPDGRYVQTLDEYDFDRKTRVRRLADELFRTWFARLDDSAAVLVYETGELPMGMNMQRPKYSTMRLYSPKAPRGIDLFRMSYRIGSIQALWAERADEATFVTRFDHGLAPQHPSDRAWTVTLQ